MKARTSHRIAAKAIDLLVVIFFAVVLPKIIGPLVGFFYSLCCDGIAFKNFQGQSLGKICMGLKTMSLASGKPASYKDSMVRNSPIGVATFFAIIPVWGWIILILIGLPILAIEVYLIKKVESGHRLGDVMADTEVIELPRGWLRA